MCATRTSKTTGATPQSSAHTHSRACNDCFVSYGQDEVDTTRAIVDGLLAAINAHDVDRIVRFYDETVTNHGIPVGPEGMREVHELIFKAFPDWRVDVDEVITSSDRAVARGRLRGTHKGTLPSPADELLFGGALRGIEPAGRAIDVAAIHIWEFSASGTVTAHWAVRDDLTLYLQVTGAASL